ncbi:BnaCnng57820D, partial [Brassica napus]
MRGAHGDDMLFVNEKVPSQLSSNDSVAYNACSPHHNSLNKPVAKILFPEIKTSKLKGAYSLLVKIFARAGDFQNQVQPLEEALNRMSMRVVEYEKY